MQLEENLEECLSKFAQLELCKGPSPVEEMTNLFKTHPFFHERYQFLMAKEQAQIDWNSFAKLNITCMLLVMED